MWTAFDSADHDDHPDDHGLFLILLGFSTNVRWYHHVLMIKTGLALWLGAFAVVQLWSRRLTGTHLLACSSVLESQSGLITTAWTVAAYFLVIRVAADEQAAATNSATPLELVDIGVQSDGHQQGHAATPQAQAVHWFLDLCGPAWASQSPAAVSSVVVTSQ